MDGGCVHHHVNAWFLFYISRPLPIVYPGAPVCQVVRKPCLMGVRTRNGKSFFQEDFRQAAHADASNPYKMNM